MRRLERIRELLRAREGMAAEAARPLCFGGAGFTEELRAVAEADPSVQLIGLDRLYDGS
ncbi:hypothetical protein [Streptomyces aidingensis]|uniref:Uncharacterized protein n=1 Tax=Streptomyces aidingensis TaxID=910347 RepID=A0A1I1EDN7_9ACTN|nr:hypothetical protein [Streptomyces aidingensis]SFB85231.1 hypothetical protein SAMN05421773_101262 [Streptomyces aidingensis]